MVSGLVVGPGGPPLDVDDGMNPLPLPPSANLTAGLSNVRSSKAKLDVILPHVWLRQGIEREKATQN